MNYFKSISFLLMALSFTPLTQSMEAPLPPASKQLSKLDISVLRENKQNLLYLLPSELIHELCKFMGIDSDKLALFWNYKCKKEYKVLPLLNNAEIDQSIIAIDFNNKKQLLCIATQNNVIIYNCETCHKQVINEPNVRALKYNANNNTLIVNVDYASSSKIKIIDIETETCIQEFTSNLPASIGSIYLSKTNKFIKIDGNVSICDLTKGIAVWGPYDQNICFNKKSNLIYRIPSYLYQEQTIVSSDINDPNFASQLVTNIPNFNPIRKLVTAEFTVPSSRCYRAAAIDTKNNQLFLSIFDTIRVVDLQKNIFKKQTFAHKGVNKLYVDTKRNCLISLSAYEVKIWDIESEKLLGCIKVDLLPVCCFGFNKQKNQLLFRNENTIFTLNLEDTLVKNCLENSTSGLRLSNFAYNAYLSGSKVNLSLDKRLHEAYEQLPDELKAIMLPYVTTQASDEISKGSWKEWLLGKRNK